MKKAKVEKTFLEELTKVPNISIACERVNLSRQTIYRWMDEDWKFRNAVEKAIQLGDESINDLAESKLVSNIKSGSPRAIEYWLNNHKRDYLKPRPSAKIQNGSGMSDEQRRRIVGMFRKV